MDGFFRSMEKTSSELIGYPTDMHTTVLHTMYLEATKAEKMYGFSPLWNLRGGALYVEMGFNADISWESRCNIEINVWAHFYKILLVFEVPYRPQDKAKTTKSW